MLGLGVAHAPSVQALGHEYRQPLATMRAFLDALDDATESSAPPVRVLAALGPSMLALARDRSAGAHPYLVTPGHSSAPRRILGPTPGAGSRTSSGRRQRPGGSEASSEGLPGHLSHSVELSSRVSGAWALTKMNWPAVGATGWSTPWWHGETPERWPSASRPTLTPAPTTSTSSRWVRAGRSTSMGWRKS